MPSSFVFDKHIRESHTVVESFGKIRIDRVGRRSKLQSAVFGYTLPKHTHTHTHKHTHTHTHKYTYRHTHTWTHKHKDTHRHTQTNTDTGRNTQKNRDKLRQTKEQTHTHTQAHTHTHAHVNSNSLLPKQGSRAFCLHHTFRAHSFISIQHSYGSFS